MFRIRLPIPRVNVVKRSQLKPRIRPKRSNRKRLI
jgi:hypothetical protein